MNGTARLLFLHEMVHVAPWKHSEIFSVLHSLTFTVTSYALSFPIYIFTVCSCTHVSSWAALHWLYLMTMKTHILGCQENVFGCQLLKKFSHSCHQQIIQNIWFASPTGAHGDLVTLSKKMWGEERGEMERDSSRETGFDQQESSLALWQPKLALLKQTPLSPSCFNLLVLHFALYSHTYSSVYLHLQCIDCF